MLLKLYVDERGMAVARAIEGPLVVSALTRVEAASALWRKHRGGELDAADAARLTSAIAFDLARETQQGVQVVALTPGLVTSAASLTERHPLRAGDAVQLASALTARAADPSVDRFATADRRLAAAAEREDFVLVPGL